MKWQKLVAIALVAGTAGLTEAVKVFPEVPWLPIALAMALALNKMDWVAN